MVDMRAGVEPCVLQPLGACVRDALEVDDLRLTAVTEHGWRITDRRLPIFDPCRVVAFVERCGDNFEVMQLGAGIEWTELPSLDDAVAFVVTSAPRIARERLLDGDAWAS